jgi:hypothetical protein
MRNPSDSAKSPSEGGRGEAEIASRTRVTHWAIESSWSRCTPPAGSARLRALYRAGAEGLCLLTEILILFVAGPAITAAQIGLSTAQRRNPPPRAVEAERFLAQRGWPRRPTRALPLSSGRAAAQDVLPETAGGASASTATWQPLGPVTVSTPSYGLISGRVSSIALDPADPTGNRVYLGTTGGGVWLAQNAGTGNAANVVFAPLTDAVGALSEIADASISIGAVTVQPGGTGVILAGTGDPNDALDSYYGVGILRSTDGGATWSLIPTSADHLWSFAGEGFAGFAWSTVNPQLVVAAVSQAFESTLVNATRPNASYEGLYFSSDGGATWSLGRITDGNGTDVQGPGDVRDSPDGNAATSVVWNPVRNVFMAAVRYHGYYQSSDGVTWTRLAAQPGTGLTTAVCPTNPEQIGSLACPIFRGTLAVNPQTGDTFAWTVDINNQDQGLWQDPCGLSAGVCSNQSITFSRQWNTTALESDDPLEGPVTIENGDYNLALAAVPSAQDTVLLAGANDLWKCSLAEGCTWRNTTNALACMSAQVAPYQHALAWNPANPLEILVGNDSGLWRSMDAVGETSSVCSPADAAHFQNLNGGLGSLAEIESLPQIGSTPYSMMAGLGVNGTAGVKSTTGPTADWPQILGGEGGPVAIDTTDNANWYVNNAAGVSIHLCSQTDECTPSAFGAAPNVTDADVGGDGYTMTTPAPFLVDPLDATQLLVGTCRVWRGPANGNGWTSADAISPLLDGAQGEESCNGDPLIRTLAAMAIPGGNEEIYAGMYGAADGGEALAGHVFAATLIPGSNPHWLDLTDNPVTNDSVGMNAYGLGISSIFIDPHDPTGNTVYVTVEGFPEPGANVRVLYRTTDGGAHWLQLMSNLPPAPANSVVVDPQDANTVYLATDVGVFSTRQIGNCTSGIGNCWSAYGTGLPEAPVTQLSAAPASAALNVLVAGTYGRGIWQLPLWTAGEQTTSAIAEPAALSFSVQAVGATSSPQTATVTNTGAIALLVSSIAIDGDFSETDNCQNGAINGGASCAIQVTFAPTQAGSRTGALTISANVEGGAMEVALSGTGSGESAVSLLPASLNFGPVAVGSTSSTLQVTVQNGSSSMVTTSSFTVSGPFALAGNACANPLPANSDCQLNLEFAPSQAGAASGTLTMVDSAGTQTAELTGTGAAPPTDMLSPLSLTFPGIVVGQASAAQAVSLTNSGGLPLTAIVVSVSGPFQVASNCSSQLAASSSCSMGIVFVPTAAGGQTGALAVVDALHSQTVTLAGTGLQPPAIGVNPSSVNFAVQQVGVASSPVGLTISNLGGAPLANVGFQLAGQAAASFAIGPTNCGATLNNGSSCTAQLSFTPANAGGNAATLIVSSSTLGVTPVQVPLSGTGHAVNGLNVSPSQMTFTVAAVGQPSAVQTATISNTSAGNASGLAIAVNPPFSLTQNGCPANLAAGANCSVGVVFTPAANGAVSGVVTITAAALNPAAISLNGIGGAARAVQIQPAVLSFPSTGVGTSSPVQTVTLTNSGQVVLTGLALSVSSGFQISSTTCTSVLATGSTCTAGVSFSPLSAGQQTGDFSVTSASLASAVQATISGMGVDFSATATGSPSQTVSSGQTASFTLKLVPMGGSSATFTFSCGQLPEKATCTFDPGSETVAANATGTVTVLIATGQATSAGRFPGWTATATILCAVIFLPFGRRRQGRVFLLAALLGILATGISSCTGSGGGTGGSTGGQGTNTPPGTYSIPVTIAASGVSHSVTLTMTVD